MGNRRDGEEMFLLSLFSASQQHNLKKLLNLSWHVRGFANINEIKWSERKKEARNIWRFYKTDYCFETFMANVEKIRVTQ